VGDRCNSTQVTRIYMTGIVVAGREREGERESVILKTRKGWRRPSIPLHPTPQPRSIPPPRPPIRQPASRSQPERGGRGSLSPIATSHPAAYPSAVPLISSLPLRNQDRTSKSKQIQAPNESVSSCSQRPTLFLSPPPFLRAACVISPSVCQLVRVK